MGLDNGFVLRNKITGDKTSLFHFRNYYELANYFRQFDMLPKHNDEDGESHEYEVTESVLTKLQQIIFPIYSVLIALPGNTVAYYDEVGYPQKYAKLFYSNSFNPIESSSSFAGRKLIQLYQRIDSLLEILDNLEPSCYNPHEIIFYDSF
jgi:hypothetical protein